MKDLFIIPECYIDTNLVETLIKTDGCNHQKGCNTVVKVMNERFAKDFALGIVDKDKRQIRYASEFEDVVSTDSLGLKKHPDHPHYLIMIDPAVDGFILKCAEELQLRMEDFGFSSELKRFTDITKSVTGKNDPTFKKLFRELRMASEMRILKGWIEYLRARKWESQADELRAIANMK